MNMNHDQRDQGDTPFVQGYANIDEMIDAVLDAEVTGEIDERTRDLLLSRIQADPRKAAELQSLRGAVAMLREPVQPMDFSASVARQVQFQSAVDPLYGTRSSGAWVLPVAIAAGVILAAVAGFLFIKPAPTFAPQGPSPAPTVAESTQLPSAPPRNTTPPGRTARRPERDTALPMGPTDRHEIAGKWDTAVDSAPGAGTLDGNRPDATIAQADATTPDGSVVPGRLVSVRVGPAWSLWWIPSDSVDHPAPGSEPWRVITRLANPTTNATVNKPQDAPQPK